MPGVWLACWVSAPADRVTPAAMCGRFVQLPLQSPNRSLWPGLAEQLAGLTAKYNLAPTQRAAVVMEDDGQLSVYSVEKPLVRGMSSTQISRSRIDEQE